MLGLCVNIWTVIFNKLDLLSQLRFRITCTYFYNNIHVTDLYNIPKIYKDRLNDKIIKQYKHLKLLDASGWNCKVSGVAIQELSLHTLNASRNPSICDVHIQNMTSLHVLYIAYNCGVSDIGLVNLCNLHTLDVHGNLKITDEGIKGKKLKVLNASGNKTKITDGGIMNMPLVELVMSHNNKITKVSIETLKYL